MYNKPFDSTLEELVKECNAPAEEFKNEVIAIASAEAVQACLKPEDRLKPKEATLSSKMARQAECSMGTLLATALREGARDMLPLGPDGPIKECHGALINGGSIRAGIEYEGNFTFGDLIGEFPFPDPYIPVFIRGKDLAEGMKFSRQTWLLKDGDEGFDPASTPKEGKGLHCDTGFKLAPDPEKPGCFEVLEVDGQPFDPEKEYTIVMGNRLCQEKSSNKPLAKYAKAHPEKLTAEDSGGTPQALIVKGLKAMQATGTE